MPKTLKFEGPNHTVDIAIICRDTERILLIRRGDGRGLALPGGFVESNGTTVFTPDTESWAEAAVREAGEETGLPLDTASLIPLPSRQGFLPDGSPRDPRDSADRFTVTHPFLAIVPGRLFDQAVAGDDAAELIPVIRADARNLFADHDHIVRDAYGVFFRLRDNGLL